MAQDEQNGKPSPAGEEMSGIVHPMKGKDWSDLGFDFDKSYRSAPGQVKCECIRLLANTFVRNIDRIHSLAHLPMSLIHITYVACDASDAAIENTELIFTSTRSRSVISGGPHASENMKLVCERIFDAFVAAASDNSKEHGGEHLVRGLNDLASSLVIMLWTCFESLTIDLWVNALNASLVHAEAVINRLDENQLRNPEDTKFQSKSINLNILHEYKYDLRDKMGMILHREQKVWLGDLKHIEDAYKIAFGPKSAEIFERYKTLPTIEAMRNLYAHRGGIADKKFLNRVGVSDTINGYKQGDVVGPTASGLKNFIDEVTKCCVELIVFVDAEMQKDARIIRRRQRQRR